jgi:tetratricopeptide (TPR) repeat protein
MLGQRDWLEILMRLTPFVLCLGLAASTLPVAVIGQRPDDQIAPQSVALVKQGETLLSQGKLVEADDALESALVVDPKNRAAFTVMARVSIKQKLYGQAIRLTNKALSLEPTDRDALAVQGEAMVELGALPRAKENLAKLQKLCGSAGCPQVATLSTAIARGPALAAAKTPDVPKKN